MSTCDKCTSKFLRLDEELFFFKTFSQLELLSTYSTIDIEFGMFYNALLGSHIVSLVLIIGGMVLFHGLGMPRMKHAASVGWHLMVVVLDWKLPGYDCPLSHIHYL